jgi:hypothetical protein
MSRRFSRIAYREARLCFQTAPQENRPRQEMPSAESAEPQTSSTNSAERRTEARAFQDALYSLNMTTRAAVRNNQWQRERFEKQVSELSRLFNAIPAEQRKNIGNPVTINTLQGNIIIDQAEGTFEWRCTPDHLSP